MDAPIEHVYVTRGGITFEKRSAQNAEIIEGEELRIGDNNQGFFSRLLCPSFRRTVLTERPPDADFCASSRVKLSHGITAYRLTEPSTITDEAADSFPVIVCLHGMYNCSYMWADAVDLLCDCERGPNARVLIFDFYGRGRSPWTGVPCTLDVLVVQTKELLDVLGLSQRPVSLIGFDMGGAVATGFAAKYPDLCQTLTLLDPMGVKYRTIDKEELIKQKYIGEYMMYNRRNSLAAMQLGDFKNISPDAPHRPAIDKQVAMVQWQVENTPGYLGAILSGYRLFPLRGMEELYTAIGRYDRPVLVIWGDKDSVATYGRSIRVMEQSFPRAFIVDIRDCGHNCLAEKFNEVMTEVLSFHKISFDSMNETNDAPLQNSL